VQILVQHGAVIDQKSLSLAVETNRTEIVKLLVEKEQHLDFNANNLISIVLNANPKFFDLLEYILKKGSDPNSSCGDVTNLGKACKIDCFDSVRCLLQNGANVNGRGAKGTTPLMLTYSNMDLRIATLLVSSGANVNQKDDQGWTALLYASHYGNLELVQFLHKSGADISLENDVGSTALTEAHQHTSIIKYLLDNGANINHKGENDSTILFRTCFHGNYEGALYLIENGADVNGVTEFEHFTPLHGAAFIGHVEIVKLLLSSNANLTLKSSVGTTPIVTAVDQNKLEVIKLFPQELLHLEATGNKNGILDKSKSF
jgi:ankyrin repeat protein